ncbi:hypothetical protein MAR_015263 [Mya arenaria]|uniref:Uncharacterized protein n=1 Tax=Mya arenaria TaxID=6604 RepID=A0ABY7FK90_MYAAR|nr:hypothetical protein MAR_015263 [Mya arenaria]
MLLHVCGACRQYVVDLQLAKVEQMSEVTEVKDTEEGVISKLAAMDGTLSKLQKNIIGALVQVPILKKMSPYAETDTQSRLLKAYIKAIVSAQVYVKQLTFEAIYLSDKHSLQGQPLQALLVKLYEVCILVSAQVYVKQLTFEAIYLSDKHSLQGQPLQALLVKLYEVCILVSAQVYVKQLTFEAIYLSDKHSLQGQPLQALLVVEEDTSRCLLRQGEDIDAHNADVSSIVRSQVKSHRLIRPSRTKMVTQGSHHVASILLSRLSTTLHQVSVQLDMKTINRSFPDSKTAVKTALQEAESLTVKDLSMS